MKNIQIRCPNCGIIIQIDADKLYIDLHLKHGAEDPIDVEIIKDETDQSETKSQVQGQEHDNHLQIEDSI